MGCSIRIGFGEEHLLHLAQFSLCLLGLLCLGVQSHRGVQRLPVDRVALVAKCAGALVHRGQQFRGLLRAARFPVTADLDAQGSPVFAPHPIEEFALVAGTVPVARVSNNG